MVNLRRTLAASVVTVWALTWRSLEYPIPILLAFRWSCRPLNRISPKLTHLLPSTLPRPIVCNINLHFPLLYPIASTSNNKLLYNTCNSNMDDHII